MSFQTHTCFVYGVCGSLWLVDIYVVQSMSFQTHTCVVYGVCGRLWLVQIMGVKHYIVSVVICVYTTCVQLTSGCAIHQ